ncbi:energy transducer TonB [Aquabacterium sp.]|uniref:energy transducer TonB n=1 Tax=Aquabacterium sp. TaxID=1872578 RepID=UPI0035AEA498
MVRRALLASIVVGGHLAAAGWMARHASATPAALMDAPSVVVDLSLPDQPTRRAEPPAEQPTPVVRHAQLARARAQAPAAPTESVPEPATPRPAPAPAQDSAVATVRHESPSADPVLSSTPSITPARFDADYLHNPKPDYPAFARRMGEMGRVLLRVSVTPQGLPDSVAIASSSGSPRLDDAALQTVKRWRFVPARQGETAVQSWVTVPITFNLEG